MDKKEEIMVGAGSKPAPEKFYIQVTADGPYLVYGNPVIEQEIITPNEQGVPWEYKKGMTFDSSKKCVALCRCGRSAYKPYCDGVHTQVDWDPRETSSMRPILEGAVGYEGPALVLADNENYCAFARFCDGYGKIWNLVQVARTDEQKEIVRHEAEHCPAGRLILFDKATEQVYEPELEPSVSLLEDPAINVSGPLWVKGGIRIESANGRNYEIRNRVTLCRCGMSSNKPFCNGAHASVKFRDGLPLGEQKDTK